MKDDRTRLAIEKNAPSWKHVHRLSVLPGRTWCGLRVVAGPIRDANGQAAKVTCPVCSWLP